MLVKVDRMSMAHSLEVRVPFRSKNCRLLPVAKPNLKIRNDPKIYFKRCFKKELPLDIIERRKHGFEVPS